MADRAAPAVVQPRLVRLVGLGYGSPGCSGLGAMDAMIVVASYCIADSTQHTLDQASSLPLVSIQGQALTVPELRGLTLGSARWSHTASSGAIVDAT